MLQEKNRIAARRHRMALKHKETEEAALLAELEQKNRYLKQLVAEATEEVKNVKKSVIAMLARPSQA